MKTIILSFSIILFALSGNSQESQFRVDCNYVAVFLKEEGSWSEWFDANNTFVINANTNSDIYHYRANGSFVQYRNLGGLEVNYTEDGNRYQILNMLDESGNPIRFQLFDDPYLGVKIISNDAMVQFSM